MARPDASTPVYSPSDLNREAKIHLEAGFPRVWVEGEISGHKRYPSGHHYFALKDAASSLRCVMFKGDARGLAFEPRDGTEVLARGRLTIYEKDGRYQLIVGQMEDAGLGALQRRFEALKKSLSDEGLFDESRKRTLPRYPRRIAVVTSPSGAAIRDVLQVLNRRWPLAAVRVYGVPVQGDEAAAAIARAIAAAGQHAWADVIITGRGGGSLEDLWAFNEEVVARAIADCEIPIVSAVGHETDFSIADFVADLRAPTPSAAAELVTPDRVELMRQFTQLETRLQRQVTDSLRHLGQRLDHAMHRLEQRRPDRVIEEQRRRLDQQSTALFRIARNSLQQKARHLDGLRIRLRAQHPGLAIDRQRAQLDELVRRQRTAIFRALRLAGEQLGQTARTLNALSPLPTLARGYAVLQSATGELVGSTAGVGTGDRLRAQLADGGLEVEVTGVDHLLLDASENESED